MSIRSGFRRLVLDSGTWQFKIGESYVQIFSPDGKKYVPDHSQVTGLSWDTLERLHCKNRGSDHPGNIRPSKIREWIDGL